MSARAYRRLVVAQRVIVNLRTGRAFRGLLTERQGTLLVLRDAELLEAGTQPVAVDGAVVIETNQVEFIQVVGA